MITRRLTASLVAVPLAVSLAACSSSDNGSGAGSSGPQSVASGSGTTASVTSSAPSTSSSASASASSSGAGGSTSAAQLLASLRSANASVTSFTFRTETTFDGTTINGTGKQKVSSGQATAFDLTQKLPNGQQRILLVNGKAYISQPGLSKNPAKPYVLISASSSNPLIRQLATSLKTAQSSASIDSTIGLLTAAKSVTDEGTANVAGQQTKHYKLIVDPTKLPVSAPNAAQLKKAGLSSLPIDVYLDDKGRAVQTVTKVTAQGKTVSSTFVITGYNVPVTISAPPASQVTTG